MNNVNQGVLKMTFPELFRAVGVDKTSPFYTVITERGIECDDGWNDIIIGMCKNLCTQFPSLYFIQIKEKFGKLRVYYECNTWEREAVYKIIRECSNQSVKTCEICGAPGQLSIQINGFLMKSVCQAHRTEYGMKECQIV